MSRLNRKQLFVEPQVQGAFLLRVIIYFVAWLLAAGVTATVLGMTTFLSQGGQALLGHYGYFLKLVLAASLMLLPIILYDIGVLTNRVVGPLNRLRNELHRLGEGQRRSNRSITAMAITGANSPPSQRRGPRVARLEDELEQARAHEFSLTTDE